MKLLLAVMIVLVLVAFGSFAFMNEGQQVDVNLWGSQYSDVALYFVVFVAFAMGAAFVAIIALAEGSVIRLSNRRLRRQIHKLETETSFLRSQPETSHDEPDAVAPDHRPTSAAALPPAPSRAPVYDDPDDTTAGTDDDVYSGGRAV